MAVPLTIGVVTLPTVGGMVDNPFISCPPVPDNPDAKFPIPDDKDGRDGRDVTGVAIGDAISDVIDVNSEVVSLFFLLKSSSSLFLRELRHGVEHAKAI